METAFTKTKTSQLRSENCIFERVSGGGGVYRRRQTRSSDSRRFEREKIKQDYINKNCFLLQSVSDGEVL